MDFITKTATLMYMGACLGIGFWGAKKLTNIVDEWQYERSDEYKKLVEDLRKENQSKDEIL